ncbi:VanZ family protein [Robertmurraya sp. FSL R5-0851]|uniref:VanZ family protein n=1 Tax=Robertmurraya sp. FSL R5-0851 TaxID=2921584 RepID=UPI0030F6ECE8
MKQIYVAICIGIIIIIGNTLGELGRSELDSINQIYKKQVSPLFLLETSGSFYHKYSIKEDFPYLAIRKTGHFFFYGLIAISLFRVGKWKNLLVNGFFATILTICVGILDEVYQYFLLGRSGRMLDVLVDAAGCFIFVVIYMVARKMVRHRDRSVVPLEEKGT